MPPESLPDVPPPKKRSRRWLALFASIFALLCLAEIACRIDALFPLAPFDSDNARKYFELRQHAGADQTLALYSAPDPITDASSVRPIPHPYLGWTSERAVRVVEEQARWFESTDSQQSFDVFVLGGSVAAQFGNEAGPRLETALATIPVLRDRRVRVWNNAHSAYKAPQTASLLAWLLALGQRPDAVLLLDGFNEVAIGMTNARSGVHPLMPSFEFWGNLSRGKAVDARSLDLLVEVVSAQRAEQALARHAIEWGFHHSALLTRITLRRLTAKHQRFEGALALYLEHTQPKNDDVAVRGTKFEDAPEAVITTAVRGWTENARHVEALCRAHDMKFVHVLQPTLYDPGSKPMTAEEERFAGGDSAWKSGVELGYPRLREAGVALASDEIPFTDLTRMFAGTHELVFVDMCHLNERGCALLADAIAAEFRRVLR